MQYVKISISALFMLIILMSVAAAQVVGTATLPAPAVILANNTGSLTQFTLTVQKGNGNVVVNGPAVVGNSTKDSALTAARYASSYLKVNFSNYNFTYKIKDAESNVSGPSAGAAMTLLAISALSGSHFVSNFTITGTISSTGTIGPIGGIYDKASAAKAGNLRFILAPAVSNGSEESDLYVLVQDRFNLPVIEVSNISQAAKFAFSPENIQANAVTPHLYTKYNLSSVAPAPLSCSNNCYSAPFIDLTNFTVSFTNASMSILKKNSNFSAVTAQLYSTLNQSEKVAQLGYLYAGSDFAFLSYIDSFYFDSYLTNNTAALRTLEAIQNGCSALFAPQLTATNYEYVIGGELRQNWGEYTANSTIGIYNSSVETTDDALSTIRAAGQANGWCAAAGTMYSIANNASSSNAVDIGNLSSVAYSKVNLVKAKGPGLYINTAEAAYKNGNYAIAILDADYQIALSNATTQSTLLSTSQMLNMSNKIAQNATYGIWATQFANAALFYISQAKASTNQSTAHSYAIQALSSAELAAQIGKDMQLIHNSFVPATAQQQQSTQNLQQLITLTTYVKYAVYILLILAIVILVVNLIALIYLLKYGKDALKTAKTGKTKQKRTARK